MATTAILTLSVLLAIVILAQNAKGSGLAAGFSAAYQFAGVARTTHFLNRATWVIGGTLMLFCLVS
ncbi:MAG: preprotein translocase subunit SecG [Flavobacteriales bacterium]